MWWHRCSVIGLMMMVLAAILLLAHVVAPMDGYEYWKINVWSTTLTVPRKAWERMMKGT